MGRQRWLPPIRRGHIWTVIVAPSSPQYPSNVVARARTLPAVRRGHVFAPTLRSARYVPTLMRPQSRTMLPMRRGHVFGSVLYLARPGPLAPTYRGERRDRLTAQPRGRITNYLFTPGAAPVHPGPVIPVLLRRRPYLPPSSRGHISQVIRGVLNTGPQYYLHRSRPSLVRRTGFIANVLPILFIPPPAPAPLTPSLVRRNDTRNSVLRIRRGSFIPAPNPYVPPPPRPPFVPVSPPHPVGGSLSVSVSRRKWPQPVLYEYAKSLVWRNRG